MKTHHVGVVGGGQLARMAGEAASELGLSMVVLAEHPDDAACDVAAEVVIGSPLVESDLRALAARCEVMTFDHEQVDLSLLRTLVAEGVVVRPGVATLEVAVDKAHMRRVLVAADIAGPAHIVVDLEESGPQKRAVEAIGAFATDHGWPVVLKAVRGGYDGKGVWPVNELAAAAEVVEHLRGSVLVEEMVPLRAELAIMVARRPSGEAVAWPAVETAQVGGVCREVLVPGRLPPELMAEAVTLGQRVAGIVEAVGVLAVELFWSTDGRLLVNEIAARPHNSGHWTIEGAVTSQFENHLRAVLDLPLGTTALQHARVASVNIFGSAAGEDPVALLPAGLAVPGAHVHLYGKEGRPGRKLGHVTVCGDDAGEVRSLAWAAALAMGTPRPDGLDLPTGSA
ncbi:MAG TPA: 5-(carboxyamino)imidazole ribonucleotide synthase [Acidimicrobiales bacterium]|nr:5-(carboxyamino)imidazole ribonucleotide synthase [Acidimicrobiales bacterium]